MSGTNAEVAGLRVVKAIVWAIYAIAIFAVIVIAFGFFLLLFGASSKAGFAEFIYSWSVAFSGPFQGMISSTKLGSGGEISWSALFAIAAYSVAAWLLGAGVNAVSRSIYRQSRSETPEPPAEPTSDAGDSRQP